MAVVNVRDEERRITNAGEISEFLDQFGIWYRRFDGDEAVPEGASEEEVLEAYAAPIDALKEEGGYITADVIDITSDIPNLDSMLAKFEREHWHDEDEVRFIVEGRGLFHIHPESGPVFSIEVERGDMINVPSGTHHWFHLCDDRRIRAIRLFKSKEGWVPHYTETGTDEKYIPTCFGPEFIPVSDAAR